MKQLLYIAALLLVFSCEKQSTTTPFEIAFDPSLAEGGQNGRLLLMFSNSAEAEPRFQISDGPNSQQVFGMDVSNWQPGEVLQFDMESFGYPVSNYSQLPEGKYYVQALLNRYETYNLSTGHTVQLPPDKGEGQQWNRKPGNWLSQPMEVEIKQGQKIEVNLDFEIPAIKLPSDTKYIKHVKMKSERLSEFWGTDVVLGANVLLPEGFEEHPEAHYPLMVFHGHFPADFYGFRTTPVDSTLQSEYSQRFQIDGYNKIVEEEAYDFYKQWTSENFPRFIIINIQHANPYYDDSYAVNSANIGPYGDAITYELIPHIEKQFRGIGEGWSRFLYGGSTGGWEALAAQVMYPEAYNGCFAACPDPIDFRAYMLIDIYEDENAYFYNANLKQVDRPAHRDYLGHVNSSVRDMNHRELALGTKSRSGQQFDIWEAVYSPMGEDGYPKRIWDKKTGAIDHEVAAYWKENYDLRYIMEKNWATLGPKLEGKINIYCGDMDNYYLNNAVYLMEDFLEGTKDPFYNGKVDYGDRAEHCWNGDHDNPNYISRLRYNIMYVPQIMERIKNSAPAGADLTSWRY